MTPPELRELLLKGRRGDDGAFERFVVATREALFTKAKRLVRRETVAEEILQEAYLALWSSSEAIPENPEAWMARVVVNRSLDEVRKEEYRKSEPLDVGGDLHSPLPDPLALAKDDQFGAQLDRLIAELPPSERAVFLLRAFEEWSFEEISVRMGTAPSTARNQYLSSRRRLAGGLKAWGRET